MRILFFGDIFGRPGREALRIVVPQFINEYKPDFIIGNVENLAHGTGVTLRTLAEVDELGVFDAYTSGNHIFDTPEARDLLNQRDSLLLRPLNYPEGTAGKGALVATKGTKRLLVVNAMGRVFMKDVLNDPFAATMQLINGYTMDAIDGEGEYVDGVFVGFHAEVTPEKRAFAFYLDGHVSAIVGTHTHVPTKDAQVLPNGTAYITDAGMVGPMHSSLGLNVEPIIEEFLSGQKQRREVSGVPLIEVGAVIIDIGKGGLANNIEHIRKIVEIS